MTKLIKTNNEMISILKWIGIKIHMEEPKEELISAKRTWLHNNNNYKFGEKNKSGIKDYKTRYL